jgi:hypothetical protein
LASALTRARSGRNDPSQLFVVTHEFQALSQTINREFDDLEEVLAVRTKRSLVAEQHNKAG